MDKTRIIFAYIFVHHYIPLNYFNKLERPIVSTNTSLKDLFSYFGKLYSHFETLIIKQFLLKLGHMKNHVLRCIKIQGQNYHLRVPGELFTLHLSPLNNGH